MPGNTMKEWCTKVKQARDPHPEPPSETGAYYIEWSKPERKTPIQYTHAYIWNLERW